MNLTGFDFQKIIVWVLIWLFGYSLGLLEAWVKGKAKKKTDDKPEVIQAPPQMIEEDYALALFENNEQLTLKLDKAELNTPTELNDTQRKRLVALVVKLRPWLEGKKSTPQHKAPPVQPVAQPKPSPAAQTAIPVATPASTNISSQPLSIRTSADELEYSRLDMAGQINWILQKKLENHPLRARKIRLEGALTGGVHFYIGEQSYEYVDEIPDPEIKALFKEASAEWEKKSTPGL